MLDRGAGNYEVTEVMLEHNHLLHLPETRHLMASQRKISELQAFEIETADDSRIRPKAEHVLASRQTFLAAHNGKQPRTIYMDQDAAMGKAIYKVFTESYHGLCTFHIMQNCVKHLSPVKDKDGGTMEGEGGGEEGEDEGEGEGEGEDEETHILSDFSACMYGYEDEAEFQEAFDIMRSKVHKQTWLDSIYKVKKNGLNAI